MTLVVIGPHGVGKSTLGRALAAELDWVFHHELGETLARQTRTSGDASSPQVDFDRRLFGLELGRDRAWSGGPRVVESWHPGNLAYAERRSPELTVDFRLPSVGPVWVLPLHAPRSVLARRKHEPGPLDFFMRVGQRAGVWAERLGLRVLPQVHTHTAPAAELARRLAQSPLFRSL